MLNSRRTGAGFTLLEVMVTLVVVSTGLLGFAGLLNKSIASNRQAYYRSQATVLANDVVERMRVNRVAALAGSYNLAVDSDPSSGSVAGDDLVNWIELVSDALPAGDGAVSTDGSGNVTVNIQWFDGKQHSFATQTTI